MCQEANVLPKYLKDLIPVSNVQCHTQSRSVLFRKTQTSRIQSFDGYVTYFSPVVQTG